MYQQCNNDDKVLSVDGQNQAQTHDYASVLHMFVQTKDLDRV